MENAKVLNKEAGELSPELSAERLALYKTHGAYSPQKAYWTIADYLAVFYAIESFMLGKQYIAEPEPNSPLDKIARTRAITATQAWIRKKGELSDEVKKARAREYAEASFEMKIPLMLARFFAIERWALKKQNPNESHNQHGVFWQIAQKRAEEYCVAWLAQRKTLIEENLGYFYTFSAADFKNAKNEADYLNLPWTNAKNNSHYFEKNYLWDAVF